MKKVLILLVFSSAFLLRAQISLPESLSFDTSRFMLSFRASHDIQSSALRNEFASILVKGGTLTDEIKDRSLNKHKEINRLGREFTAELLVADYKLTPFKGKRYGIMAEAGYQSLFAGAYSKDAFQLAFYGNASYVGDSAKFSGSEFQYLDFQNFGLGLINKRTKSYVSLNVVNIQNYFEAEIRDGSFYLSPDSTQAAFKLDAWSKNTYSSNFSQGLGVALNFCINFEVDWRKEGKAFFQFKVKNLGVAKIRSVQSYSVDSNLDFGGFQLDDFLENDAESFDEVSWLDTLGVKTDTVQQFIVLPAMMQFGKILDLNSTQQTQSFFGIKLYPRLSYVPKIYLGIDHKLSEDLHVGASCSYGGFGLLRAGVYAAIHKNNYDFGIGTEDLLGAVSKNGFGQMVCLNFKCIL
ncbi:MAG: hypothetical protein K0R65_809 [Crocinitomicaceae bacterium]|jgi:hypothetical protein|nr:hypothetical protein [Crocinitomicaceae bacterium]